MNYNEFKAKFVEKELEELEVQIKIMLRQKPHRSVVEFSKIINKIRRLLNITFEDEDPDNFIIVCDYFYKLYKFYYIENHDLDFEMSLIEPGVACLTEQCIQFLRDEFGFEALFERPDFVA